MKILDLGSGLKPFKREGAEILHLDKIKFPHVELVCDVNFGIAVKNDVFDFVRASHVIEHLRDIVKVMDELWRIIKPNGKLQILTPLYTDKDFWRDPTHVRPYTVLSFDHFDPETGWGKIAPYTNLKWKILFKKVHKDGKGHEVLEVWLTPRKPLKT